MQAPMGSPVPRIGEQRRKLRLGQVYQRKGRDGQGIIGQTFIGEGAEIRPSQCADEMNMSGYFVRCPVGADVITRQPCLITDFKRARVHGMGLGRIKPFNSAIHNDAGNSLI